MTKKLVLVSTLAAAQTFVASAQQSAPADMQKGLAEMMKAMTAAAQANAASAAALVDHRQLRELLPAAIPGFKRTGAKSERSGALGMTVAQATAEYTSEAGGRIQIQLSDLAGTGALGAMAHASWTAVDMDSESDTGYEKTMTFKGYKAMEKYDNEDRSGEMNIFVAQRFSVQIEVSGADAKLLQQTAGLLDLKKLETLKPAPAPAAK